MPRKEASRMNRKNETVRSVVLGTVRRQPLLCTALVLGGGRKPCCRRWYWAAWWTA